VNAGLMTLFFFVIGLEARREFDLGELRDRRVSRSRSPPASAGC
jgi:Na+/H+ antiporter NhaA